MPSKQPNPRNTFNYYLGVQENLTFELRILLQRALSDVEQDIKKVSGKGIGAKIEVEQMQLVKKSLHETIAELYRKEGFVVQAAKHEASAAAFLALMEYESVLLDTVMNPKAVDSYLESAKLTSEAGINAAMKRMLGDSYHPLSYNVYKSEQLSRGMVDRYLESALARGLTARQIAKGVQDLIDPNVRGGVSYAAMRLGRTEINNAFHAVSIDRYQNSPYVVGVDWHLSGSHPEGDECDDLAAGGPYDKQKVPKKPHPQCFCYITPAMMSEEEFLEQFFGPTGDSHAVNEAAAEQFKHIDHADLSKAQNAAGWSMNEKEREALVQYIGREYEPINSTMRGAYNKGYEGTISQAQAKKYGESIQAALSRAVIPEDIIVYRGQQFAGLPGRTPDKLIGATWTQDGFLSTSTKIVRGEELKSQFRFLDVQMEIMIPGGSHGAAVGGGEGEVLLPAGSTFQIVDAVEEKADTPSGRIMRLKMVMIP